MTTAGKLLLLGIISTQIFLLSACRAREFADVFGDAALSTADRIRIMNQGDEIISEDDGLIESFVSMLHQLTIRKMPPQPPATGSQYSVRFFYGDTQILSFVTHGIGTRIDINFTKYYVETPDTMEAIIALIEGQYQ